MSLFIFIAILVVLIWVHELGHFLTAKFFRVRVDEFSIGFPPRLFSVHIGETRYSVGSLLIGGYVSIFGEREGEGKGDPRALTSKPRAAQAAIVAAGIASNILLAWVAFSVGYMAGLPASAAHSGFGEVRDVQTTVVGVLSGSPAERAGFEPQDIVIGVQTGRGVSLQKGANAIALREFIAEHQNESLAVTVLRDEQEHYFVVLAEEGLVEGRKAIGVELDDVGILQLPPHLAFIEGARLTVRVTRAVAEGLAGFLGRVVQGSPDFSAVAGPIGIVAFGTAAVGQGFAAGVFFTAVISISLALINLLPVPGLDGGRLLIIAIEAAVRRSVPERVMTALTVVGFGLLIALMLVVSFHDISRLLG